MLQAVHTLFVPAQLYRKVAKAPEKLNRTRGIGVVKAPPDFVASVIADDYESWDDTIKELKLLKSERDPVTGALVEIIWTRYCFRKLFCSPLCTIDRLANNSPSREDTSEKVLKSGKDSATDALVDVLGPAIAFEKPLPSPCTLTSISQLLTRAHLAARQGQAAVSAQSACLKHHVPCGGYTRPFICLYATSA